MVAVRSVSSHGQGLLTKHYSVILSLKNATQPFVVNGDALVLVERLDDEFTKILQNTDAHSTDYVHKLVECVWVWGGGEDGWVYS